MKIITFPSNSVSNDDPFPRELELLDRCTDLWKEAQRLAFTWNQQAPSDGAAQLAHISARFEQLPAPSTERVGQIARQIESTLAALRFRQAFPIVEELDADSLIPNAARELSDAKLQTLRKAAAKAQQLFGRGDARAQQVMASVEQQLFDE